MSGNSFCRMFLKNLFVWDDDRVMGVPSRPFRKALRDPGKGVNWVWRNWLGKYAEPQVSRLVGTTLFAHDWDLAIVLDSCRFDLAEKSFPEYDLPPPSRIWSLGYNSETWIRRTLANAAEEQLAKTGMITGNLFSASVGSTEKLALCDEVWRYAWDDAIGTVLPRPITDRTIRHSRKGPADKLLVHYMQPHLPAISEKYEWDTHFTRDDSQLEDNVWEKVNRGLCDPDEVTEAYRDNVDPVLSDVNILLSNVDAENVVITADHGNALGEHGHWGHHTPHTVHDGVRFVPWAETTAEDTGGRTPDSYNLESTGDITGKLRSLGYR